MYLRQLIPATFQYPRLYPFTFDLSPCPLTNKFSHHAAYNSGYLMEQYKTEDHLPFNNGQQTTDN